VLAVLLVSLIILVLNKKPSCHRDTTWSSISCEISIRVTQGHWK